MAEEKRSNEELEKALQKMLQTSKTFDNFQKMMQTTRSFDEELDYRRKQTREAISDAFAKMINLTEALERDNAKAIRRAANRALILSSKPENNDLVSRFINKLPVKYRKLPSAFRRSPQIVIKYFLGMIIGRILAIILYVVAAFIPALPVPDSVSNLGGRALGGAVGAMRGFFTDPAILMNTITNIPTDINKLLQKIGEFFQFYGRRAWAFIVKAIRNPKLAYEDIRQWSRRNSKMIVRLCRSAMALTCSFIMIKLAMIFLLPLFGVISLTVLSIKVSLLLFVVVKMIFDKVGELIGTIIFSKIARLYRFYKVVRRALDCWK